MVVSMTENDPNAHEDSGVHASSATGEQTGWSAAEGGQAGQPEPSTTLLKECRPANSTYPFEANEPWLPVGKSGMISAPVYEATSVVPS